MREWWSKIRVAFGGRRELDDDLREELDAHLELEIRENLSLGMPLKEARRVAQRHFGNMVLVRENAQDAWALGRWEILLKDFVYASRMRSGIPASPRWLSSHWPSVSAPTPPSSASSTLYS